MRVGVDFDNTLACYDGLFHRIACEKRLIDPATPASKTMVRDALRAAGKEQDWIALQGLAYGRCIGEAPAFDGALAFFTQARQLGWRVFVISHKTRRPVSGDTVDLHAVARNWLETQGFFDPTQAGLAQEDVFFETTKAAKLARIEACGCDHFIDDLPEFLAEPTFPAGVKKWLIHAGKHEADDSVATRLVSWSDAMDRLMTERTARP